MLLGTVLVNCSSIHGGHEGKVSNLIRSLACVLKIFYSKVYITILDYLDHSEIRIKSPEILESDDSRGQKAQALNFMRTPSSIGIRDDLLCFTPSKEAARGGRDLISQADMILKGTLHTKKCCSLDWFWWLQSSWRGTNISYLKKPYCSSGVKL